MTREERDPFEEHYKGSPLGCEDWTAEQEEAKGQITVYNITGWLDGWKCINVTVKARTITAAKKNLRRRYGKGLKDLRVEWSQKRPHPAR